MFAISMYVFACIYEYKNLSEVFPILAPQNPWIDETYVDLKSLFWILNLCKARPGNAAILKDYKAVTL